MVVEILWDVSVDKLKRCYLCKKEMTLDNFYLSKNGNYNFCCSPCDRKRKAVYRAENKEKIALAENKYINTEKGYVNEVIGGIFWVWVPVLGINEVPDTNTIVGGFFIFISLVYYSLVMRWNKRYIALN